MKQFLRSLKDTQKTPTANFSHEASYVASAAVFYVQPRNINWNLIK